MMPILDHIATGSIIFGMLAIVIGFFIAASITLGVAMAQPDFWQSQFGSFHECMQIRSRVGALARQKENTTRSGRIADWVLKRGTILLAVGGIAKAVSFFVERYTS
jgi:hypothetical protein